jgi:hypothetical protein
MDEIKECFQFEKLIIMCINHSLSQKNNHLTTQVGKELHGLKY